MKLKNGRLEFFYLFHLFYNTGFQWLSSFSSKCIIVQSCTHSPLQGLRPVWTQLYSGQNCEWLVMCNLNIVDGTNVSNLMKVEAFFLAEIDKKMLTQTKLSFTSRVLLCTLLNLKKYICYRFSINMVFITCEFSSWIDLNCLCLWYRNQCHLFELPIFTITAPCL